MCPCPRRLATDRVGGRFSSRAISKSALLAGLLLFSRAQTLIVSIQRLLVPRDHARTDADRPRKKPLLHPEVEGRRGDIPVARSHLSSSQKALPPRILLLLSHDRAFRWLALIEI